MLLSIVFPFIIVLFLTVGEYYGSVLYFIPFLDLYFDLEAGYLKDIIDFFVKFGLFIVFTLINFAVALGLIGAFFTTKIVTFVNNEYYKKSLASFSSPFLSVNYLTKSFSKFVLSFLLTIVFVWIPFIGPILPIIPAFIFFKRTIVFDVACEVMSKIEFFEYSKKRDLKLTFVLFIPFLFSFIPVLNIFVYLFAFLVTTNYLLDKK